MGKTSIEWTDRTWNPVRGCSRVSEGCRNCYAERQATRFSGCASWGAPGGPKAHGGDPFFGFAEMTKAGPRWTGKVELVEKHLEDPLHWRQPSRVFVNSMSDLFHEGLPDEAIDRIFAVMALCPQHTFQVLTKRPRRMFEWSHTKEGRLFGKPDLRYTPPRKLGALWPFPNVWLGVSVEDQATADERIPLLLQTPAALRFVSYEPALGPVEFFNIAYRDHYTNVLMGRDRYGLPNLDWIIVGGESGPGARLFDIEWARETIAQCGLAKVPCFVKQFGAKVLGPHDGFAVKRFIGSDGKVLKQPKVGPRWRPPFAIGFTLYDHQNPLDWAEEFRVRQFPRHGTFTVLMGTAMQDADADAERVLRGDA
jgi:protein gp37